MAQTTITVFPEAGQPGQLVSDDGSEVISRIAAADVVPGTVVVQKTDGTCTPPTATGDVTGGGVLGVVQLDPKRVNQTSYAAGTAVTIVRRGTVYVNTEDSATLNNNPFVRFSASGNEVLGAIRSDADTSKAVALPGAYFDSTSASAGLVAVRVTGNFKGA